MNLRPVTRREAYAADITYGTNNEFGFDYLRDNMVDQLEARVQRERSFAIVDEVDNILIDEARTPLIISGQAEESADLYFTFARLVPRLKARPEGDEEGGDYFVDLKDKAVSPTEEGIDKIEQLLGHREPVRRGPAARPPLRLGAQGARAVQAGPGLHRRGRRDRHRGRVHRPQDAGPALERGPAPGDRGQGGPARPARVPDPGHDHVPELLPPVRQAGRHDRHGDDRGRGVPQDLQPRGRGDPHPPPDDPRRLPGPRVQERGLQVQRADRRDRGDDHGRTPGPRRHRVRREVRGALARCSSGAASGTRPSTPSSTSARPASSRRRAAAATSRSPPTWPAAARTSSSAATRRASRPRSSTSATSTPPRWTRRPTTRRMAEAKAITDVDHEKVVAAGGLHIIGTERHESRRIDNQLRGRAARQGDPGSSRFYLSLDDDLMKRFASERVAGLMERMGLEDDVAIESRLVSKTIESAQTRVEGFNFDIRKRVVEFDDVINQQRETIYAERDKVLRNEDLTETVRGLPRRRGRGDRRPVPGRGLAGRVEPRGADRRAARDGPRWPGDLRGGARRGRAVPRRARRVHPRPGGRPPRGLPAGARRRGLVAGGAVRAAAHDRQPVGRAPDRARRHAPGHRPARLRPAGPAQRVPQGGVPPLRGAVGT